MAVVTTTAGAVSGRVVTGGLAASPIDHFGGVPYASATRFAAPGPVAPWDGERDASRPGAAAPQRTAGLELVPGMAPEATSEDCLTAEVWTPGLTGLRPVLVWIPGGSFRIGGASLATYDGRHLAADGDLVVVGLNYRLGVLGFHAADGVPSNLGLRDLLAGIEWVRTNARAFGGDPDRIVLMGESAGAGAITHLLTRPDLGVAGAIVLSGSATMTLDEATARTVAATIERLAGGPLDGLDVEAVLDAQDAAVAELAATVGMMPFHPWVDGDVVPVSPLRAAADGTLAAIPLVFGTTAHEMELFRDVVPTLPTEWAQGYLLGRGAPLGLTADGIARGLAACEGDLVPAIADIDLVLPAYTLARSHARRGLPVWRARFSWEGPGHRACHAIDLPFHFGTLDVEGWRRFAGADGEAGPGADRLSARIRAAWAAFAATGVPACEPVGAWPVYDGGNSVVDLGAEVAVIDDPDAARLASWG